MKLNHYAPVPTADQILAEARRVLEHPCSSEAARSKMAELIDLLADGQAQPTPAEADGLMRGVRRLYATAELVRSLFGELPPTDGEVQ